MAGSPRGVLDTSCKGLYINDCMEKSRTKDKYLEPRKYKETVRR